MKPLVVGSPRDRHVRAVVGALSERPVVLDAPSMQDLTYEFRPPDIRIRADEWQVEIPPATRGWVRRLSPMSWEAGTTIGSHDAVVKASWLALLAGLLRHPDIRWLSDVDTITRAENKITQYTVADRLGIPVPQTVASNSPAAVRSIDSRLVAKPLGPGHFQDRDGRWLTVFADAFEPDDPDQIALLSGPPFLIQEMLRPAAHLRITTVRDRAWVFRLPASDLPIDWRQVDRGHSDWRRVDDERVGELAIALAQAHELGYSSQDWIETEDDQVFLDLNPSGQWLFLPSPGADEITYSIAEWLG